MKIFTYISIITYILIFPAKTTANSTEDVVDIVYSEWYAPLNRNPTHTPSIPKAERLNKNSATIIIQGENLSDEIRKTMEYATSVWESCLHNNDSIFINVEFADIPEDIRTTVRYFSSKGTYIPTALKAHLENQPSRDSTYPDGTITINSTKEWDYSLNENISADGSNLTYGILRAIARILGFGSSVTIDDSENYKFSCKKGYSIFDNLIKNSSDISLTSINLNGGRINPELKSYINEPGQTFWIYASEKKYQLQSPPFSLNKPPFVFLNNLNSLMSDNIQPGDYNYQIDNITRHILNSIGWNTQQSKSIMIVSEDVPETGLASAYDSHRFKVETPEKDIVNPKWELKLPLYNGGIHTTVLQDYNLSCTVPPIKNETDYIINYDGDIEGILQFSCSIDNKEITTVFKIYFELKPIIDYAIIERIFENPDDDTYDAYYKVNYRGTEKIKISIEEEFSSVLRSMYINEPYIARGVAKNILKPFYAWIDFTAENKYGKSVFTLELQPGGIPSTYNNRSQMLKRISKKTDFSNNASEEEEEYDVEVFDLTGKKITTLNNIRDISNIQQKGILIIRKKRKNHIVQTYKIKIS